MRSVILTLSIGAIAITACETNTQTGALVGTGVGAGVGALISPTPAGVLIGAGVGAATGALVGSAIDANDRDNIQRNSPRTMRRIDNGQQLTIDDIKRMSEAGIADDKIIGTIHSTGSVYYLSESDVEGLREAGVSQRVIDYMMQTSNE